MLTYITYAPESAPYVLLYTQLCDSIEFARLHKCGDFCNFSLNKETFSKFSGCIIPVLALCVICLSALALCLFLVSSHIRPSMSHVYGFSVLAYCSALIYSSILCCHIGVFFCDRA